MRPETPRVPGSEKPREPLNSQPPAPNGLRGSEHPRESVARAAAADAEVRLQQMHELAGLGMMHLPLSSRAAAPQASKGTAEKAVPEQEDPGSEDTENR